MNPQKQRLLIMILAGVFGLLILIGVGFTIFTSQKGKVIIVKILPHDATIKLDGREVKTGIHYVNPGKHQFVITRAVFKDKTVNFEIKASESQNFELYTRPIDDSAGAAWAQQNPEEAREIDGYDSRAYEENARRVFDSNQILSELPILDNQFRIDQGFSKTGKDFALYIQTTDDAGKAAALDTLRTMGYDPNKLEIIYTTPE